VGAWGGGGGVGFLPFNSLGFQTRFAMITRREPEGALAGVVVVVMGCCLLEYGPSVCFGLTVTMRFV
jgi:hypothetical protein